MRKLNKISLFFSLSLGLSACSVGKIREYFTFSSEVPLEKFEAKSGHYFPGFIHDFFDASRMYEGRFPSLAEARSAIRLIQVKRLSNDDSLQLNESNLSWSADGVYLSFEKVGPINRKIQIKNIAGNFTRDLAVLPKGSNSFLNNLLSRSISSYNASLSWSRDSTRYAFMSNGGMGEYNVYVGAVGVKEHAVARSPSKDGYASWSPTSDELVFVSSRTGQGDLYLIRLGDNRLRRLTKSDKVDLFPDWSASGKHLVYCSGDAKNHDIMMLERLGRGKWRGPWKLTGWQQDDLRPTISPDGKLIAFYSSDPKVYRDGRTRWNIHVIPLVAKTFRKAQLSRMLVAKDVVVDINTGPAWTPDSQKIFYVKHDSKRFNPIHGYDLYSGRRYHLKTGTRMNRDILMSNMGVLSFRAQVGAWDRIFIALTNQGNQLQGKKEGIGGINYEAL